MRIEAQTVGADQPHASLARCRDQLVLQLPALVDLAESAGNHLRESHASPRLREQGRYLSTGNRDERIVDDVGRAGETAIGRQSVYALGRRVYRIDCSFEAELTDAADEDVGNRPAAAR